MEILEEKLSLREREILLQIAKLLTRESLLSPEEELMFLEVLKEAV